MATDSVVVDLTTDIIKSLVRSFSDPKAVLAGIHNAFVFGELLEDVGLDWNDDKKDSLLEQLLEHLSQAGDTISKMEDYSS